MKSTKPQKRRLKTDQPSQLRKAQQYEGQKSSNGPTNNTANGQSLNRKTMAQQMSIKRKPVSALD